MSTVCFCLGSYALSVSVSRRSSEAAMQMNYGEELTVDWFNNVIVTISVNVSIEKLERSLGL